MCLFSTNLQTECNHIECSLIKTIQKQNAHLFQDNIQLNNSISQSILLDGQELKPQQEINENINDIQRMQQQSQSFPIMNKTEMRKPQEKKKTKHSKKNSINPSQSNAKIQQEFNNNLLFKENQPKKHHLIKKITNIVHHDKESNEQLKPNQIDSKNNQKDNKKNQSPKLTPQSLNSILSTDSQTIKLLSNKVDLMSQLLSSLLSNLVNKNLINQTQFSVYESYIKQINQLSF